MQTKMSIVMLVITVAALASAAVLGQASRLKRQEINNDEPVTEPSNECVCVRFYQCNSNFTLNKYGAKIFDIRANFPSIPKSPCESEQFLCCKAEKIITNVTTVLSPSSSEVPPTDQTPVDIREETPTPVSQEARGCGYRNKNGVGFQFISGKNEAQFAEFPWIITLLGENETYICGGSLIHPKVVLTSAHCVKENSIDYLIARAGEWDRGNALEILPHQDRKIAEIIKHEHFHQGALLNDIALLILQQPMELAPNVNVVCLPRQGYNFDHARCVASGWGKLNYNSPDSLERILQKVDLPVVPKDPCVTALRKTRLGGKFELHGSFICAGGMEGQDTCTGDGGSPLICPLPDDPNRYQQAGIVAWGIGCGDAYPAAYASVSTFRKWIDSKLIRRDISILS